MHREEDRHRHRQSSARLDIDGVELAPWTQQQTVDHVFSELGAGRGGVVVTPNVDIMRQLRHGVSPQLRSAIYVADGAPLVWASRLQGTPLPERVTGADLVWSLAHAACRAQRSIFLLGAAPGVAERAATALRGVDPGLEVAGTLSPDLGFDSDSTKLDAVVRQVTAAHPDLVFIALGFPRQECLAERLLEELPQTWFLGCGGAFDMAAGDVARAHAVVQRCGGEWVHRLAHEPRRLARRYLVDDVPYAIGLLARSLRRRHHHGRTVMQTW